jgi:hypothetical protein
MFVSALATLAVGAQLSGQALLNDLSYRAFTFFWNESNTKTGLSKDRAANLSNSDTYTVASIASTGYSLAAYGIGVKRGWITQAQAVKRSIQTLYFLTYYGAKDHGWFYHFIDWNTGQRVWSSEVSSIDTAILISGMLVDSAALNDPSVTAYVNNILNKIDWNWMLTDGGTKPASLSFCMGWTPEGGFLPYRWDTYDEELQLYLEAYAFYPKMPAGSWAAINRTPYNYQGLAFYTGGPLFMHQMSQGFYPFASMRDSLGNDYWVDGRNMWLADRQYCATNPNHFTGYSTTIMGLTACDTPTGYSALGEPYGPGGDDGTLAPTSAAAGVMFAPTEAIAATNAFRSTYPADYGRYGFSNGINPTKSWIDPDVIGIDLGMMMMSIEDTRDGFPNKMTYSNAMIQKAYQKVGLHLTSEGNVYTRPLHATPGP